MSTADPFSFDPLPLLYTTTIMRSDGADGATSSCEDEEEAARVVTVDPQKVPRCEMRVTLLITVSALQEHVN